LVDASAEEAFREFVAARLEPLRRTAYLLCRDWYLADDLVSTTAVKLYRHWGRVQRVDNPDGYARRVLLRCWLDEQRRPWRRERVTDVLPERAVPAADVPGRLAVLDLLAGLPARKRAILVLRFYCDLSVEDTAEILGCAVGTVKSQTTRGLDLLRTALTQTTAG
jgi:RNA polymerase sigma-70 factor (sigma-E family)